MNLIIDCLLCHGEGRLGVAVCPECSGDGDIEIGSDADSYMEALARAFRTRSEHGYSSDPFECEDLAT